MNPTVTFTRKLVEPPNTFRATDVSQMYDEKWSTDTFVLRYDVGIPPKIAPFTLTIRNRTVSHDLMVQLIVPEWFTTDFAPQFVLNRNGEMRVVTFTFNEDAARELSKMRQNPVMSDISLIVTPMQVNGPVYVMNSTEPL